MPFNIEQIADLSHLVPNERGWASVFLLREASQYGFVVVPDWSDRIVVAVSGDNVAGVFVIPGADQLPDTPTIAIGAVLCPPSLRTELRWPRGETLGLYNASAAGPVIFSVEFHAKEGSCRLP